jgi:hypothetical protein
MRCSVLFDVVCFVLLLLCMCSFYASQVQALQNTLIWLDNATKRFLIEPEEIHKSGLLRTSAMPQVERYLSLPYRHLAT